MSQSYSVRFEIVIIIIIIITNSQSLGIASLSKNRHLFRDPVTSHIIIMVKWGSEHFIPSRCLFL